MTTTVRLDKDGRVAIPKTMREAMGLEPGDKLELESKGETFTLRPTRSAPPLRKEQGVWVFRGSKKVSSAATDRVLQDFREDRKSRRSRP